MKKIAIFSFSLLLLSSFLWLPSSNDNGIKFQEITFNQALTQAKKEHKFIFMNVYAVWCAPCTNLKKTTFQSDKIGSVFNKSFINISVDAEKGEGINLSRKYEVTAHPLMLVINSEGKVVKRILGYVKEDQLLKEVKGYLK
jgi:thioredoxin 1